MGLSLSLYIYIYTHVQIDTRRARERERERESKTEGPAIGIHGFCCFWLQMQICEEQAAVALSHTLDPNGEQQNLRAFSYSGLDVGSKAIWRRHGAGYCGEEG